MIKKILTYSFGEILVKGSAFLVIPLYSHLILPIEYGTLGFLNALVAFLPFIFTLYYLYAFVRFSVETEEKRLISTFFYLGIFLNIFYLISALIVYGVFIKYYDIALKYFILSILGSSLVFVFQILQLYYRSKGLSKSYIRISVSYSLIGLSLNFLFLLLLDDNVLAMLLSAMSTSIIATLFAYKLLFHNIKWKLFDLSLVVKILKYSIPLVPGAIALLMFSQSDKIILINYISKEELGIYALAFTIGLSMAYIGNAFFMAYQPIFYDKLSKGLSKEIENGYWKILVFLLLALLLSFLAIFIVYQFINIKYIEGFKLSLIIALAYCFVAFSQIMELHLTYMKKTSIVSIVYGFGGILTISTLFILIPLMGTKGAALSLFISAFVISVFMYNTAQKYLFISYNKFYVLFFYLFMLSIGGFILWI